MASHGSILKKNWGRGLGGGGRFRTLQSSKTPSSGLSATFSPGGGEGSLLRTAIFDNKTTSVNLGRQTWRCPARDCPADSVHDQKNDRRLNNSAVPGRSFTAKQPGLLRFCKFPNAMHSSLNSPSTVDTLLICPSMDVSSAGSDES